MNKHYMIFIINIFLLSHIYSNNDSFTYTIEPKTSFLSHIKFSHSGYTNAYAINRISDNSIIKVPFRLMSYDFAADYKNFSFKTKFGVQHKIKSFNSSLPLSDIMYDLVSTNNIDYTFDFREYYLSYFPSFGEIKIGKQIHAWGVVDGNSPIDVTNPIDYYYLFTDSDETKIGRESIALDLYFGLFKLGALVMPNHITNNIPSNDPDFPIVLPASPQPYQMLEQFEQQKPVEFGGYLQASLSNMDWAAYYFSGYDRNFNLYGANVFLDNFDVNSVVDTIFSYRKTEMIGISNVSFISDLTVRFDFAYFQSDSGNQEIESRPYLGQDELSEFLDFNTLTATNYFDISGQYYQYCLQLEYGLPLDIDFTTQLFGYEKIDVQGNTVDIDITNFEIYLNGKDVFYPGMGSSMATLCENSLLFSFNKTFMDDLAEIQVTNLLDIKDKGQLHQLKLSYNIFDNLNISFLLYHGVGNRTKYTDITFIDEDGDGENDDELDNETGRRVNGGDGIPDADMFDESLLYPFNAMEDFSHMRLQLQYFF